MKIINWNVGRPTKNRGKQILDKLNELDGDILVLTETNSIVTPPANYNLVSTKFLPTNFDGVIYADGENRTSIWTKFPVAKAYKTFDDVTSVCADISTPFGLLTIYATIIGVFGGKGQRFQDDLQGQLQDFDNLFSNKQVCLIGDYNVTFTGFVYPSYLARQTLNSVFEKFVLTNLTSSISDSVDHIAISNDFIKSKKIKLDSWNLDKSLSDHIGVSITLTD